MLRFDPRLDPSRRYCRPWTRDFVDDLSQAYYNRFHQQIQVNSAVRTVKVQKKLRRHNRNAAPADGDTASSHLAGVTVDLQRRGMSKDQIRWMEHYLFYMKALGLVEPEEERHQWVFHIMVSGHYSEWRETQDIVPVEHPDSESRRRRSPWAPAPSKRLHASKFQVSRFQSFCSSSTPAALNPLRFSSYDCVDGRTSRHGQDHARAANLLRVLRVAS